MITAWLALGLWDNIFLPDLNRILVNEVLQLSRMEWDHPEMYALLKHRAIRNPRYLSFAFRAVIVVQALAVGALMLGTTLLGLALLGAANAETARAVALIGATLFTGTWCGFLVVGNYLHYWLCHEGSKDTHLQMALWGFGVMLVLFA